MALEKICYSPSNQPWAQTLPVSASVRVGDLLFIAGQVGADDGLKPLAPGDVGAQARQAFARIRELVEQAGGSLDDVVDIMSFHKDPREMDAVFAVGREVFAGDYPAWTAVGSLGFYDAGLLVSIRAIAHLGQDEKQCYTPDSLAWLRALPISGACRKGDYMFVSGQLAADADGQVIAPSEHAAQARHAYARIDELLALAGGSSGDVIDMICFNQDVRGMDAAVDIWCNEVSDGVAIENANAYTAIATTGLYRLGQVGSYRAIADFSAGPRVATNLPTVHWHTQRISGATKKAGGRLIGISGQVASDGAQNIVARGDTAAQARYCFGQIEGVLAKHGAGLDNIVEITSFHKDPRAWEIVMAVGQELFPKERAPAWTPVGCTGLYLEGYLHEIYALAMI